MSLDWDRLQSDTADLLADELGGVLDGAREDVEDFARDIARELVKATKANDADWKAQLLDQMKLLAEINRVRANEAGWGIALKVVGVVGKGIALGLKAALL